MGRYLLEPPYGTSNPKIFDKCGKGRVENDKMCLFIVVLAVTQKEAISRAANENNGKKTFLLSVEGQEHK